MQVRGYAAADLRNAPMNARSCTSKTDSKWKLESSDPDGDDLSVVVVIVDGLLTVTLF